MSRISLGVDLFCGFPFLTKFVQLKKFYGLLHVLDMLFRFLRYVPVVYVDYPGAISLTQIYGTFNRAMLRLIPSLRSSAQQLTDAMVEFYTMSQVHVLFI